MHLEHMKIEFSKQNDMHIVNLTVFAGILLFWVILELILITSNLLKSDTIQCTENFVSEIMPHIILLHKLLVVDLCVCANLW
jgi:hypothetical protein